LQAHPEIVDLYIIYSNIPYLLSQCVRYHCHYSQTPWFDHHDLTLSHVVHR
jgi:L-fuculose-phosphate aldolase